MAGIDAEAEETSVETPTSDQTPEGGARAPPGNQAMIARLSTLGRAISRDDELPLGTTTSMLVGPVEPGTGAEHRMQQSVRS